MTRTYRLSVDVYTTLGTREGREDGCSVPFSRRLLVVRDQSSTSTRDRSINSRIGDSDTRCSRVVALVGISASSKLRVISFYPEEHDGEPDLCTVYSRACRVVMYRMKICFPSNMSEERARANKNRQHPNFSAPNLGCMPKVPHSFSLQFPPQFNSHALSLLLHLFSLKQDQSRSDPIRNPRTLSYRPISICRSSRSSRLESR